MAGVLTGGSLSLFFTAGRDPATRSQVTCPVVSSGWFHCHSCFLRAHGAHVKALAPPPCLASATSPHLLCTYYVPATFQSLFTHIPSYDPHVNSTVQKLRPREGKELVQRDELGISSGGPTLITLLCAQDHPFSRLGPCPGRRGQGLQIVGNMVTITQVGIFLDPRRPHCAEPS